MDPVHQALQLLRTHADLASHVISIEDLYTRKLWHQLTGKLDEFLQLPFWLEADHGAQLISFYAALLKEVASRLSQLKLAQFAVVVARHCDGAAAVQFLETVAAKVKANKEAYMLCQSEIAAYQLRLGKLGDAKALLESTKTALEGVAGVDSAVYSSYYRAATQYYLQTNKPSEFCQHGLMYLAYTPLDSIPESDRRSLAFELCLASIIGEGIYSFGELLANPILNSLVGTSHEWMTHLLRTFSSGSIAQYKELTSKYAAEMSAQPGLVANGQRMVEKMAILSLMELVFGRPATERSVTFADLAAATCLPINEVELLVMKALSLKLVRGVINQVAQTVLFTWVQPRVLDAAQINTMKEHLGTWTGQVQQTLMFLEDQTPELFV